MGSRDVRYALSLALLVSLMVIPQAIPASASQETMGHSLRVGPYVDGVLLNLIDNPDMMALNLQAGDIIMHSGFLTETRFQSLISSDPGITGNQVARNGYGHIIMNCRDYPLNMSVLRRAFALAMDKNRVRDEVFDGFSVVHDSLLPTPSEFCIEDSLPYHYYDADPLAGNALLDAAGFDLDAVTGWRSAPNGDAFNITIEYDPALFSESAEVASVAVDALHSLFIDAQSISSESNEMLARLDVHGDYDMVLMEWNYRHYDAAFTLDYGFRSDYADLPYANPSNFRNASFDFYCDLLQHAVTHEEALEAATGMQLILHEQVPHLVCYERVDNQVYRTDSYTGFINDLMSGVVNPWTMRHLRPIEGSLGGVATVGTLEAPDSFNIFVAESESSHFMLELLYPSLYDRNPTRGPTGDLATNLTVQRNSDNPDVPSGHTRYIIDIVENATWSDGLPLTAYDINFTLHYLLTTNGYSSSGGPPPSSLMSTDVPSPYRIVMEFDTESYADFSYYAFGLIIPEHIFSNDSIMWHTWNPVFDSDAPFVTCGPFLFDDFVANRYFSLARNPDFYYSLNSTGTTTTEPTTQGPPGILTQMALGISIISVAVIVTSLVRILRHRRRE